MDGAGSTPRRDRNVNRVLEGKSEEITGKTWVKM
jgi:hypothetical protein